MPGKPNAKSKDDIKLTITAIAFTIALALWNFLSGNARKPVQAADPPTTTLTLQPTVAQMTPVKLWLGGPPPATAVAATQANITQPMVAQSSVIQAQPAPKPRKPVARTRSSRP